MSIDHTKKSTDAQERLSDDTKAKKLDTPDAHEIKHADSAKLQSVMEANPDNWRSEGGHFAITDSGETIARQKGLERSETSTLPSEIADTGTLNAIRQDASLPEDKRFLASQYQEMRSQSKAHGFGTDLIDRVAGESLAAEIRAARSDNAGLEEAGSFQAITEQLDSRVGVPITTGVGPEADESPASIGSPDQGVIEPLNSSGRGVEVAFMSTGTQSNKIETKQRAEHHPRPAQAPHIEKQQETVHSGPTVRILVKPAIASWHLPGR